MNSSSRRFAALTFCSFLALMPLQAKAAQQDAAPFKVMRPGDAGLSCHQISSEISSMNGVIQNALATEHDGRTTSTGITIAKTVGGFLVGSMGGAIGILAAGHFAGAAADDEAENAENLQHAAAERRSMMVGMYSVKGCKGPLPDLMQTASLDSAALEAAAIEPAAGENEQSFRPAVIDKPHYNE